LADRMIAVGVRELKNHLSDFLRRARAGEWIVVTDRGTPVAELSPPGTSSSRGGASPELLALARQGRASVGATNEGAVYPLMKPLLPSGRALDLLDEERAER
jgi:prevent-host-death family protein